MGKRAPRGVQRRRGRRLPNSTGHPPGRGHRPSGQIAVRQLASASVPRSSATAFGALILGLELGQLGALGDEPHARLLVGEIHLVAVPATAPSPRRSTRSSPPWPTGAPRRADRPATARRPRRSARWRLPLNSSTARDRFRSACVGIAWTRRSLARAAPRRGSSRPGGRRRWGARGGTYGSRLRRGGLGLDPGSGRRRAAAARGASAALAQAPQQRPPRRSRRWLCTLGVSRQPLPDPALVGGARRAQLADLAGACRPR